MHNLLIFGALAAALASTLLLGPQWGIALGLLVYIAGNNVLLTREMDKLKAQLHKSLNDLPDLVHELVRRRLLELEQAPPPATEPPATPASEEKTKPLPELEQRLSALDRKFETLVHLLTAREALASQHHPEQQADAPPETAGEVSLTGKQEDDQSSAKTNEAPQAAGPSPRAPSADPAAELAAIHELLEKMAIMLARQGEPASSGKETHVATAKASQNRSTLAPRPTELVEQRLLEPEQSPPPAAEPPATPASEEKAKPLPELEQRLSVLDGKFERQLHPLIAHEATASPPPGEQPDSSPETAGDPTAELAGVHELLEKMAIMLAQQGEPASSGKKTHVTTATAGQNSSTLATRPTMDQLRAELDKLARELHNELNRLSK